MAEAGQQPQHRDPQSVLVGREREQTQLRTYLDAALQGHGSLVLISGEAGIGKTTLVEDLGREAAGRGALCRTGHCYDHSVTQAYAPWIDSNLFGDWNTVAPMPPDDTIGDVQRMADADLLVRTGSGRFNPADSHTAQARAGALHPKPVRVLEQGDFSSTESQSALFERVLDYLGTLANQQPLLLILEDLHWADSASVELLRFVSRHLADLRLLLIVTYRDDEMTRQQPLYRYLPDLVREASPHRINVRRLDVAGMRALVTTRYQLPKSDETRLVTYLNRLGEGNPFFAGELLWTLEERQSLLPASDGWRLLDLAPVQHVPQLLRQLIDGRIIRLSDDARDLMRVAAVIGQEVSLDLWQEVSEASDEQMASTVEQALDTHIIEESLTSGGFRFRHTLIREALYEDLVIPRQRVWHRRIAETLSGMPNPDSNTVAYHFQQAGDARAAEWWVRAGEAAQRTAWLTAAECFEAALPLLEDQGSDARERGWLLVRMSQLRRFADPQLSLRYLDEAARLAVEGDDRVLAACTKFYRGDRYCIMGNLRRGVVEQEAGVAALDALSHDELDRYRELVTSEHWPDEGIPRAVLVARLANLGRFSEARRLAERHIGASLAPLNIEDHDIALVLQIGAPVYSGLAEVYASAGEPVRAQLAFAQSRDGYRATYNYPLAGSAALRELLWVALIYHTDNLEERRRVIAEGEDDWKRAAGAQGGWAPRLAWLPALLLEGEWEETHQLVEASLATRRTSFRREVTLNTLGWLAYYQGDPERAWACVREMFEDAAAAEPGHINYLMALGVQRLAASLELAANHPAGARDWITAQDRWLTWNDCIPGRALTKILWAQYHRQAGDLTQALRCAEDALRQATTPRQPLAMLSAHRCLGELKTASDRLSEAESHLSTSLSLARACAAPYEEALTLLAKAELCIATGDVGAAGANLRAARDICEPLKAEPALRRVAQLETQIASRSRLSAERGLLSARELDVLRLVADGMTDGQVAERLYISPRTVGHHLRSIYNKLGVSSRAAAVRRSIEQDLI